MRINPTLATIGIAAALLATACGSAGTYAGTSTIPGTAAAEVAAVDPNAPEVVEPGDIPDDQVFIPFAPATGGYTVTVPEGWARTETGDQVEFTDKYNSITLVSYPSVAAPSIETVKSDGLSDVTSDPTFILNDVTSVTRAAGTDVLASYEIGSAANPTTGKKALLSVERHFFFHNETVVSLTLSGAKGADNVDPWRVVSDSLMWT